MVTFSPDTPYSQALKIGDVQREIMDEIMQLPNIDQDWQQQYVYQRLHELALAKLDSCASNSALNSATNSAPDNQEK
jgi:kynurenine 3-monooxygenase